MNPTKICTRCGDEFNTEKLEQVLCYQCQFESYPLYSGPGSGEDDLADYNQNEANDYTNE